MRTSSDKPDAVTTGPACPECGSTQTWTKGGKGSGAKALLGGGVLESLGVVGYDMHPHFTCDDCGHEFRAEEAAGDLGHLEEPCTISLHREKWFVGSMVPQLVYLNGEQVGTVKNGKTIEFETTAKINTIVVTDHNGAARTTMSATFDAEDGGSAAFRLHKNVLSRV